MISHHFPSQDVTYHYDETDISKSGFSETATYDDLVAGDCTSCEVVQDKSAYWIPALYFKKANGEFQIVQQVGGILA